MAKKKIKKLNSYKEGGFKSANLAGGLGAASTFGTNMIDQFAPISSDGGQSRGAHMGKGALKGAASGAAIGSIVPGIGTAVGAVVGGVAGAVGGLFGDKKENEALRKAAMQRHYQRFGRINPFGHGGYTGSNSSIMGGYVGRNQGYSDSVEKFNPEMNLTEFNNGGTHEENPFGGIPQGLGPDGKPNVVEAGETKFQDYIFSDRLKMDSPEDYGFSNKLKGKTFAEASKKLFAEFKERPNDPISKTTWLTNIPSLMQANEEAKSLREANKFAEGGNLNEEEIVMGTKEEMEHTKSKAKAREIAIEHLAEHPNYYSKLKGAGLADSYATGGRAYAEGGQIKAGDYEIEDLTLEEVEFLQSQGFDVEFQNEREAQRFGCGGHLIK